MTWFRDPNREVCAYLSDLCYIGGTLLLCSLQLRLQVLLFSSKLQGKERFKDSEDTNKPECNMAGDLNNSVSLKWAFLGRLTFSNSAPSVSLSISWSISVTFWFIYKKEKKDTEELYNETGTQYYICSVICCAIWELLPEHTPLWALPEMPPASPSSGTPPAPRCSAGAAGCPPVEAAGMTAQFGTIGHHKSTHFKTSSYRLCQHLLVRLAVFL